MLPFQGTEGKLSEVIEAVNRARQEEKALPGEIVMDSTALAC
ncbi:MAG: hypothetical protein ACLFUE_07380 [Desulfobacteraceae bacterium]